MKNLTFEEIRALTHGAARVTEESDGLHFHKCTERQERAWKELKEDPRVTTSMDLYHAGILFVNPCFLKRHYRIRI